MGYYFIKPKLNSSMCLAVANSTITGGQNVVVNAKTANYKRRNGLLRVCPVTSLFSMLRIKRMD